LKERHALDASDIQRVHVSTYRPALDIACYVRPTTANEARFSLTYVVATALAHGSVRMAAYEPARLNDEVTRSLMQRTEVSVDEELDAAFPGQRAARVVIETRDGRRLEHLQPNRKGDPELPLSDKELEGKFLELASPVIGAARSQALLASIWELDGASGLPRA
jgi:2-methylcitrate dehydratase PrpD